MRFRLKTLLPRSLFGRAALILVVPIVAVQLIVSITFIQRHFEGVTRQMTQGVIIEMDYLLAAVNAADTLAAAQARAAEVAGALQLDVTLPVDAAAIPATDSRTVLDWSGREIIATLRAGLAGVQAVDLTTNSRELQAYIGTAHGPLRLSLVRSRVSASNPHQLLVWMVFTSALMTVIAYVFLRNQLTPITRLADAAEAFGKGQTVPYRPRGATEVRAAGNAFLDMRARIERQIESRTLMLSGVSHDLRTPLTRLKLGLAFLPEDDETAALQQDVSDMQRLVDEFLAFARGDAMEASGSVDPAELVQRAVDNAVRAGQAVTLGTVDSPGPVQLRPQAVMRALENLVGNAVRYGTLAEVSLSMTERMVRLVVEDNGPGIPREQREEAMVPFKRLDAARDPNRGGGVGLGLSIAADIARSHGGALRLGDSERLGGLRAELTLAR
jgi:two-component system osmolarity sensor histidine kinase EnvZ